MQAKRKNLLIELDLSAGLQGLFVYIVRIGQVFINLMQKLYSFNLPMGCLIISCQLLKNLRNYCESQPDWDSHKIHPENVRTLLQN
jgi:hypothetical protein